MGYYNKTVICKNMTFEYKYYAVRSSGQKCKGRSENREKTREGQKQINRKMSAYKKIWDVCNNFDKGDYWLTLTYRQGERPEDIQTAHKNLKKLMRNVNYFLKKRGFENVYMGKSERGRKGGLHHHLMIKAYPGLIEYIMKKWECGKIYIDTAYSENLQQLGEYFAKEDAAAVETLFTASRNLKKPKIVRKKIKAKTFRQDPPMKKGCVRTHLYNAVYNGYIYQEHFYYKL